MGVRNNMSTILRVLILASVGTLCLVLAGSEWAHRRSAVRTHTPALRLEVVSYDVHIGIPGQTKMYQGRLSNQSALPIDLPACDYVTDAFGHGTELPYAVQRWDASSGSWRTVVDTSGEGYCQPYPLGKVETHRVTLRLKPSETIDATSEEATGAREPFRKGDKARFVVFTKMGDSGDWQTAVVSEPFLIEDDVIRDNGSSFRVQH
jgi:hypothetical protein